MYCESEEYNWREGDTERETDKEERFGSITLTLFLRSLGCKGGFLWFELGDRSGGDRDDSLSKLYILGSCKINSESGSSTLKTALIKASSNRSLIRDINIYINSPGGDITSLFAIYDTMQFIKNDIATICLGQAASAAAVLLAAGTKGKRLALPHSRVLLHQPYGQVGYGQVTDLEIAAKEILRMRDLLEEILAKHTGQSMERIHADTDRDFVIEANEAVEYGIIDSVISSRELTDRSGPIR